MAAGAFAPALGSIVLVDQALKAALAAAIPVPLSAGGGGGFGLGAVLGGNGGKDPTTAKT